MVFSNNDFAIAFDLDGTIWPDDSIFALFELFGIRKMGEQLYVWSKNDPEKVAKQFGIPVSSVYPGIDVELVIKKILQKEKGISLDVFTQLANSVELFPNFNQIAKEVSLQNQYLLSASYLPFLQAIAVRLGIPAQNAFGTPLKIIGKKAVAFTGPVMTNSKKALALVKISKNTGIPLSRFIAIGDSETDKEFMKAVRDAGGLAIAVSDRDQVLLDFASPQVVMPKTDFKLISKEITKFKKEKTDK